MVETQVIGEMDQSQMDAQVALDQKVEDDNDAKLRGILGISDSDEKPTDTNTDPNVRSADTTEPKTLPDSVNPDDHKKALAALKRDRVPDSALKNMTPEEVTKWGMQRAEERGKQDGYGNRLKELQKQIQDAKDTKDAEALDIDLAEAVKPLAEKFKGAYDGEGPEASDELVEFGKSILNRNKAQMDKQAQVLERVQSQLTDIERAKIRTEMPEHYELDKDDRWQDIVEFRLTDSNEYESEKQAIEAACRQLFADEAIAKYAQSKQNINALRSQGKSTVSTDGKAPLDSQTKDQIEDDLLRSIIRGDHEGREKAQRKLGRSINPSSTELMSDERIGVPSR